MAFRFKIANNDDVSYTPWYQERTPADAPFIINEVSLEHPNAAISVERENRRDAKIIDPAAVDALLVEMRTKAGWSDKEIAQGFRDVDVK